MQPIKNTLKLRKSSVFDQFFFVHESQKQKHYPLRMVLFVLLSSYLEPCACATVFMADPSRLLTATYATAAGGGCREHMLAQSSVGASGSAAATANDKRSQVRVTAHFVRHYPFVTL